MAIKVEPMRLEDLEQVLEIEAVSFPAPWSRQSFVYELLENERARYLVARNEFDKAIGYVGMWLIFDEGHITNLAVHPLQRRRGVARALLNGLIQLAQQAELKYLTLEVRRSNQSAQELYQQFGFVHMGVRRRYYSDNQEDALILWKGPI